MDSSIQQPLLNGKKPSEQQPPAPDRSLVIRYLTLTRTRGSIILLLYFACGLASWSLFSHGFTGRRTLGFVDALYFSVVSMTTVGYGDLVPTTAAAKLFACVYVFIGFGVVGLIVGSAANFLVEKQEGAIERAFERHHHGHEHIPHLVSRMQCSKHKVLLALALVVAVLGVGVAALMIIEDLGFVDSLYCVCVTVTTVGYGDRAFQSTLGRSFAILWIMASTACVAQFMLYLAELVTEEKQFDIARWVLCRRITVKDFKAADIDKDNVVSGPEYVIYKLKELGKIDQGDVEEILQEFHEQVQNRQGAITINDVV